MHCYLNIPNNIIIAYILTRLKHYFRLCQSEMAKRTANLLRTLTQLQYEAQGKSGVGQTW